MKVNYETFMRFFRNECTPEEQQAVMRWVNESEEHKKFFFRWEELYHLGKTDVVPDERVFQEAERNLKARIKDEEEDDKPAFSFLKKRWKYAAAIAAVIAFAGFNTWYALHGGEDGLITVSTQSGETLTLVLPDNSQVWLNENTTLTYPKAFEESTREVSLNGEAYFEVTKNKHKPFHVTSKSMNVEVLGTKFNFKSQEGGKTAEASLIEGEVKVEGNGNEGSITLSPGQKVELNLMTRQMKVSQTDAIVDAVWHDNLIPLNQADVFRIADILEKLYGMDIILSPDIDQTATYSGVLQKKETIEEVLKILQNTIHIDYKLYQGSVFISPKHKE